jgi:hypothetical protein
MEKAVGRGVAQLIRLWFNWLAELPLSWNLLGFYMRYRGGAWSIYEVKWLKSEGRRGQSMTNNL